jgi:DNA repair exonuclease SbcCD ATPase subunit
MALALILAAPTLRGEEPSGTQQPGLWERTQATAEEIWEHSRAAAQDAFTEVYGLLQGESPANFAELWQEVVPKLDRTLTLEERQDALPASAWLGPDQESNREAVDALLDEAVDILSNAPVQDYRRRIRALQADIEQAHRDIDRYRRERISAPQQSLVKKTVADYDRAIEARTAQVARDREALQTIQTSFAQELRSLGLKLTDAQVELLLSTVVGDNIVDLGVVFDNVKAVTAQLEQLVQASGEDLASARRYYGMYVVLLKALARMHAQIEEAISGRYIPQIDAIVARAKGLSAQTRELQGQSPEKAALLASNLEAQALTIESAAIYRRYLQEQAQQISQAREALERDIAAAWNTYETVRVSGELLALVKSSQRLLSGLMDRQVPALRPFENQEMRREFEKLTEQLRGAGDR